MAAFAGEALIVSLTLASSAGTTALDEAAATAALSGRRIAMAPATAIPATATASPITSGARDGAGGGGARVPETANGAVPVVDPVWVDVPVTEAVVRVCHEDVPAGQMVKEIMSREAKPE